MVEKKHEYMHRQVVSEEDVPKGRNNQGPAQRFKESEKYEMLVPEGEDTYGPNLVNLRDPLRVLYGKVDYHGFSVTPKEIYLKEIKHPLSDRQTFLALDFVADLYNDMLEYVSRLKSRDILSDDSIYGYFLPRRAWSDPEPFYDEYMDLFSEGLIRSISSNPHVERNIRQYKDFEKHFLLKAREVAFDGPFTKTEFVLSKYCSRFSTGLVVDVHSKASCSDDEGKYRGFLMDIDFPNVRQIAARFGFRLDYHAPWRLHCDLNSPVVQQKLMLRGVYSFTDFFNRFYNKVHVGYIEELKDMMVNMYNRYIEFYPTYEKIEICNHKPVTKVYNRLPAVPHAVNKYPKSHWYEVYLRIRMAERKMDFSDHQIAKMVKAAKDYDDCRGGDTGENLIEGHFIHRGDELSKDNLTSRRIFDTIIMNNY